MPSLRADASQCEGDGMHTIKITPRWRAQIKGDEDDIADLERLLNGSVTASDSFVIDRSVENISTLTTTRWNELNCDPAVRRAAETALRLFNGALNIHDVVNRLSVGTIYEVHPDGKYQMTFAQEIRLKAKKAAADKVTPQVFARTIVLSQRHEWLASALIEMAGYIDWPSAYRVVEAIRKHIGNEKAMVRSKLIDGTELIRIKRMANSFRHIADGTHLPPEPPVSLDDAGRTLRQALEILIVTLPPEMPPVGG